MRNLLLAPVLAVTLVATASAGNPVPMTNSQLDGVSAGSRNVSASASSGVACGGNFCASDATANGQRASAFTLSSGLNVNGSFIVATESGAQASSRSNRRFSRRGRR